MQGFLPLYDKLKNFDFKAETENFEIIEKSLRAFRIVEFGKWLSDFEINNTKFIIRYLCNLVQVLKYIMFEKTEHYNSN